MIKWGFEFGPGGNKGGTSEFINRLTAANIAQCLKGTDDAGLLFQAQQNGHPDSVLIYRVSTAGQNNGVQYDVPIYTLPPLQAAQHHLQITAAKWPPELLPARVWSECVNEVRAKVDPDKPMWGGLHPMDWMGHFMTEYAILANGIGIKVCGPAFNSGEPEPVDYSQPGMLRWLTYCAENPDKAALSAHEYSFDLLPYANSYPWRYGRFQAAIAAADLAGIPRTFRIFITEFGWTLNNVPDWQTAVSTIQAYSQLSAKFPQLEAAAIWSLRSGWGAIDNQLVQWIADNGNPFANWIITNQYPNMTQPQATAVEFGGTLPKEEPEEPPMDCNPRVPYSRKYLVAPQDATLEEWLAICEVAYASRNSVTFSYDDAGHAPGVTSNTAVLYGVPEEEQQGFVDWYALHYPGTAVEFAFDTPPTPPLGNLIYRPCQTTTITQSFGANPDAYDDFGLPGHDGTDYAVGKDLPFYAAAAGTVVHASDRKWSNNNASGYGWHVVLDHGDYCTVYAHARPDLPVTVGQLVEAGQVVGYSGNTGNSTGYHLHFGLFDKSGTIDPDNGYPVWVHGRPVNPAPFVAGKPAPVTPAPPPPAPTIDVAPYFVPSGQYGYKVVMEVGEGTQPMQLEKRANDVVLRKGDGNWIDGKRYQDSEQWRVKDGQVQKGIDTSDAGNGGKDGYDLGWAQWIPQFVQVGQTYHSTPVVKRFNRTMNCQVFSEIQANDFLHIKALVPTWVSPANPNIILDSVLIVEWRSGTPDLNIAPNETYYFCREFGYVGWGSHFILEIAEGQAPLTGALDCGM